MIIKYQYLNIIHMLIIFRLPVLERLNIRNLWQNTLIRVLNATLNNMSVISLQSVLFVEESGVPVENYIPAASH